MLTIALSPAPAPVTGYAPWLRLVRETPAVDVVANRTHCHGPRDAAAIAAAYLEAQEQEVFIALLLDAQHRVIARVEVTRGIVDASLVHPREVFRVAIALGASAIIVAHNHPSGDPTPSAPDREVTRQLVRAGGILDIPVHDHVVIGAGRYHSFAEHSEMPNP